MAAALQYLDLTAVAPRLRRDARSQCCSRAYLARCHPAAGKIKRRLRNERRHMGAVFRRQVGQTPGELRALRDNG
jgi:hypothetical protein